MTPTLPYCAAIYFDATAVRHLQVASLAGPKSRARSKKKTLAPIASPLSLRLLALSFVFFSGTFVAAAPPPTKPKMSGSPVKINVIYYS
jgi:hypothetical protein